MLDTCFNCGAYRADKTIDPSGPFAVCPDCGYRHPFRQLPLFVVAGASGAGKTTICRLLSKRLNTVVALDMDILWRPEFDSPSDDYREFFETWLRLAVSISQAGRPVLLFGAGAGVPGNIEPCVHRRYFTSVEYLALVCDDEVLAERLTRRPAWRRAQAPEFIEQQQRFNQWFKSYGPGQPEIWLVDTTRADEEETIQRVMAWITSKLKR